MNQLILEKLKLITPEEQDILNGNNKINNSLYMGLASNVIDRKKLLDRNKLIQVRPHTRFIHFPRHTHNYVEMIYMYDGQTTHIINGQEVILRKGELLLLNQNASQEILPAQYDDIAVNFIIMPEFFDRTLVMMGEEDSMLRNFITGCLKNKDDGASYLHFKVSDILPVENIIDNLIWTIMNEQQDNQKLNQMTMGLLFLLLMNYTEKVSVGRNQYEQELTLRILRFVEENYKEGRLSDLAGLLNCDLYWLSRKVKKLTDKTYSELVQIKRLNQAAYLLSTTTMTVTDIGYAVGYANLSYFYRIFRKRFHVSPKEYRKNK